MAPPKKGRGGHWQTNPKKKRSYLLTPWMKGFICTCNRLERQCLRETYNLLNEYANKVCESRDTSAVPDISHEFENKLCESQNAIAVSDYVAIEYENKSPDFQDSEVPGKCIVTSECENPLAESLDSAEVPDNLSDEDVAESLASEVSSIKKEARKPVDRRRFQVVESGVKNCLFIQTTVSDPVGLIHHILKDLKDAEAPKTRFLRRIIPVEITCKAYIKDITTAAKEVFDKYFTKEGKTFSIIVSHHNNDSINRSEIIEELAEMIKRRHPDNAVNLQQPQLTVLVEVLRAVCCLTVLPDYKTLQKYNVMELTSGEQTNRTPGGEKDVNKPLGDVDEESSDQQTEEISKTETSE